MWAYIKRTLSKTSHTVRRGLRGIFSTMDPGLQMDADALVDALIMADVGLDLAESLVKTMGKFTTRQEAETQLTQAVFKHLLPFEKTLEMKGILLFLGVNGAGKTTTLGKIAAALTEQNRGIHIIAADTFRAGAQSQLSAWCPKEAFFTTGGHEPAALVYKGLSRDDVPADAVTLIDTAGRLPNKKDLMDELKKVHGVIGKLRPDTPCQVILVLDGTCGQHALTQVELFGQSIPLDGIIVTKLDGSAKGGIIVQLVQKFAISVYALGMGETPEDFVPFSAQSFAHQLIKGDAPE